MQEKELQRLHREMMGLRIGPEMARYVLAKLQQASPPESIAVIGGDARTGLALRREIDFEALRSMVHSQI